MLPLCFICRTHKCLSLEVSEARQSYRSGLHPRQRKRVQYPANLNEIPEFPQWLQTLVQTGKNRFEDDVVDLSMPPSLKTRSFKSMKAYGQQFRVCSAEMNLLISDCGVTVTSETVQRSSIADAHTVTGPVTYYGKVQEILELDYGSLKPVLLLCDWVAPISRGLAARQKVDKYGFTLVKFSRLMRRSANSFVFPLQASKVFFSNFVEDLEWSVVVQAESRSTRVYEDSELNFIVPSSRMDSDIGEGENFVIAEEEALGAPGCSQSGGHHMTQEEVMAANAAVQWERERLEEEGSDEDSLADSIGDEDEQFEDYETCW